MSQSLLVAFCMQLASPRLSCGLLAPDGSVFGWLSLDDIPFPPGAFGGLTGACRCGAHVLLATQSTPPRLVLYDPTVGRVLADRDLSPCVDPHSLVYYDGAVYVCSTGTNEVYAVTVAGVQLGEPRLYWRWPGLRYDRDEIHLNGLTLGPKGLIATCFGPRQADGAWGQAGSLFQIETQVALRDGLAQPHTPLWDGERLWCAESGAGRVHALLSERSGGWRIASVHEVGGYPRGLARDGESLWVGISAPRRISRSRGTINEGVAVTAGAAIVRLDIGSGAVASHLSLDGLGEEVFDLVLIDDLPPAPGSRDVALARRVSAALDTLGMLRADNAAAHERSALTESRAAHHEDTEADLARTVAALQAEQAYSVGLEQALRTMTGSRLWRAAQWVRRLAGREPYEPVVQRAARLTPTAVVATAAVADPLAGGAGAAAARVDTAPAPTGATAQLHGGIFVENVKGSQVSHSGTGSDLIQTAVARAELPGVLRDLGVATMLDIPCGDFHWMQTLDLDVDYTGADVAPDLIERNNARWRSDRRRFQVIDIANDDPPRVDLIFCRDLLVHLSFVDALRAVANLKRSGSTWLLTTTFTDRTEHCDISTGQWRAINLRLPPFNFPTPVRLINEGCTEGGGTDWADKSLGLWRLADL